MFAAALLGCPSLGWTWGGLCASHLELSPLFLPLVRILSILGRIPSNEIARCEMRKRKKPTRRLKSLIPLPTEHNLALAILHSSLPGGWRGCRGFWPCATGFWRTILLYSYNLNHMARKALDLTGSSNPWKYKDKPDLGTASQVPPRSRTSYLFIPQAQPASQPATSTMPRPASSANESEFLEADPLELIANFLSAIVRVRQ
jgi:hypothetical protein